MKTSKVFFLWTVLLFSSCSEGTNDQQSNADVPTSAAVPRTAQFVLKDSIMVDIIGELDIYDYNPNTGLFLAGDIKSGGVHIIGGSRKFNSFGHLIINRKGEIIYQFKKNGNGPEEFGGAALVNFF